MAEFRNGNDSSIPRFSVRRTVIHALTIQYIETNSAPHDRAMFLDANCHVLNVLNISLRVYPKQVCKREVLLVKSKNLTFNVHL